MTWTRNDSSISNETGVPERVVREYKRIRRDHPGQGALRSLRWARALFGTTDEPILDDGDRVERDGYVVEISVEPDDYPDHSYFGEWSNTWGPGAIEHEPDNPRTYNYWIPAYDHAGDAPYLVKQGLSRHARWMEIRKRNRDDYEMAQRLESYVVTATAYEWDRKHDWTESRFTGNSSCAKCNLVWTDAEDYETECPKHSGNVLSVSSVHGCDIDPNNYLDSAAYLSDAAWEQVREVEHDAEKQMRPRLVVSIEVSQAFGGINPDPYAWTDAVRQGLDIPKEAGVTVTVQEKGRSSDIGKERGK